MSDERIHRHDWENGRCKVCGVSQNSVESESPPEQMSKQELSERLDRIEKRIAGAESFINVELAVLMILLVILLIRGC